MTKQIKITKPDDFHVHLRDGEGLSAVVNDTARRFARALVMPNLKPPVCKVKQAEEYRLRILSYLETELSFTPLMSLYLTDRTTSEDVVEAHNSGIVFAFKYYPAGATTNSDSGVTQIHKLDSVLRTMEKLSLPLLIHGEVTDSSVDVFDRERVFIEKVLTPLTQKYTRLKIVLEHITTKRAVDFVTQGPSNIAATITAHHLILNRNDLFQGGIQPHHYCLPILKREEHRIELLKAATSGNPKFFLGTDSAPHSKNSKQSACGCAGIYTAHAAIELYAEIFENAGNLEMLEAFASHFGADFYGLPRNQESIFLEKKPWTVPDSLPFGSETLVPMKAGKTLSWSFIQS